MALPTGINSKNLLLVEGKDEKLFIEKMFESADIHGTQVIDIGGKDKFGEEFPTIVKTSGFSGVANLGILRDAEIDAASTLQSVQYLLAQQQLPVPSEAGAVLNGGTPRVGIWIMPDNQRAGSIEDLCWEMVPKGDPHRICVDGFMACLREKLREKDMHTSPHAKESYFPKQPMKARIQAYLASLHELQREIGRAAQAGVWDLQCASLAKLRDFLVKLFE